MGAELVGLVVYDSVLFGIGHNVRRWADAVCTRYTANAILFAPVNKRVNKSSWYEEYPVGSMKASINGTVTRVGPKHLQTDISVDVPYAIYVLDGVDGEIFPETAPKLRLPFNPGFGGGLRNGEVAFTGRYSLHPHVSGQDANNFLLKAHEATALRHPSLRNGLDLVFQQF